MRQRGGGSGSGWWGHTARFGSTKQGAICPDLHARASPAGAALTSGQRRPRSSQASPPATPSANRLRAGTMHAERVMLRVMLASTAQSTPSLEAPEPAPCSLSARFQLQLPLFLLSVRLLAVCLLAVRLLAEAALAALTASRAVQEHSIMLEVEW